jgi:GntR family transcriptional regulator
MKPPVPKYFVIKSILQARFDRDFAPGDKLPSEHALCAEFSVSRITIQRALLLLEKEGLLQREQGRGTFYRGAGTRRTETAPSKFLESLVRQQPRSSTRLIASKLMPAGPRIAERLALSSTSPVVVLDRVGAVDNEPIIFMRAYLPQDLGLRVLEDPTALTRATLASLLNDTYGVKVNSVVQTIGATLADPVFAGHLGVEVGAPVLEGERIYFDRAGRRVIFSNAFYRADRHRFIVTLKEWR